METRTLKDIIGNRRRELGLSIRALAKMLQMDFRRLSEFEREERPLTAAARESIAATLGISHKLLSGPPIPFLKATDYAVPVRFRPKADRPAGVRVAAAYKRYPALMRALEAKQPTWAGPFLRRIVLDSAPEALWMFTLLKDALGPIRVRPLHSGFRAHSVVDPENRRVVGHCKFYALALEPEMLVIPQVSLMAKDQVFTCDALVRFGRRWFDLEIDGRAHDATRDPDREDLLKIPIVRVTEAELKAAGFLASLRSRLDRAAGQQARPFRSQS